MYNVIPRGPKSGEFTFVTDIVGVGVGRGVTMVYLS